jgi:branched-chain amino acid transport system substrate-binding protein
MSVCIVAMVAAVGACSSSSKSSSSSPTSTAAGSSGQTTAAPIKVGMICSCSGAGGFGAFIAPGRDVYQAWVNTVNASGGIDGHQVQLIADDDAGTPGTALTDVQSLISDHVVAIADLSVVDAAFASAVQTANIPVVGVETPNGPFGTNPDFYPEAQTNLSAISAVIMTAKAAGATNLANIYCAESPDCAQSVPPFESTGRQLGVPVTYNAEVSATAPNYTAQCVAAKQQHMTSMFIGDASAVIARIGSDCAQQGYNPIYVTEGAGFGLVEAMAPGLKNSLWNEFPAAPFFSTIPAVQAANAAIDKYYPVVRENSNLYSETAFMAWISGALLADAIKAGELTAGATPTAAEVTTGLDSLKSDDLQGLTVPLTFTAGQPHNVSCWFTTRVQNGTPSLVNNGQVTCLNGSST